jgi:NADPH:quinone reductase-like Zn-dependent oxidoreductase
VRVTASPANAAFVTELGAQRVIDYRTESFEDAGPVDVVFDTVGGETLERSFHILRRGGRIVTIVSPAEGTPDPRVQQAFFIVEPNRQQLIEIGALLDDGRVRTIVDSVVPLAQAPAAYTGTLPRQRRGKVVISIAEEGGEKA